MPRSREKPQDRKAGPALHAINNPSLLARYSIQLVNEVVNCGVGGAGLVQGEPSPAKYRHSRAPEAQSFTPRQPAVKTYTVIPSSSL